MIYLPRANSRIQPDPQATPRKSKTTPLLQLPETSASTQHSHHTNLLSPLMLSDCLSSPTNSTLYPQQNYRKLKRIPTNLHPSLSRNPLAKSKSTSKVLSQVCCHNTDSPKPQLENCEEEEAHRALCCCCCTAQVNNGREGCDDFPGERESREALRSSDGGHRFRTSTMAMQRSTDGSPVEGKGK